MTVRAVAASGAATRTRPPFFLWMACLCALFALAGFTPTYFGPIAAGTLEPLSTAVHIHGLLFFSWTFLFLLQAVLIARGRTATHRSVGLVGVPLAAAMVIFGFIVSIAANVERMAAGQVARAYALGFSNTVALIAFATMVALAIWKRSRPESHKRLMLFATCMLLNPPVGRLYRPVFDPAPPPPWLVFATIDSIVIACLLYDLKTLRRPHSVTIGAGIALVAFQVLRFHVPETAWWQATYDALLRLLG